MPPRITPLQAAQAIGGTAMRLHAKLSAFCAQFGKELEEHAKAKLGAEGGQWRGLFPSVAGAPAFENWPALAPATIEDKLSKGFPVPSPLLRTGALRDSIGHNVETPQIGRVVVTLYATAEYAPFQELGTETVPPRPFIGPTAFEDVARAQRRIQSLAIASFMAPLVIYPEDKII
jgi:hypothetical protein